MLSGAGEQEGARSRVQGLQGPRVLDDRGPEPQRCVSAVILGTLVAC